MEEPYKSRHVGRVVFVDNVVAKREMYTYAINETFPFSRDDLEVVFDRIDQAKRELPSNEVVTDGAYPIVSLEGKTFCVTSMKNLGLPLFISVLQPTHKCLRSGCRQVTPSAPVAPNRCEHCFTSYCSEACRAADFGRHETSSLCMLLSAMTPNPHPSTPWDFIPEN